MRREGRSQLRSVRVRRETDRWSTTVQFGGGSIVARIISSIHAGTSPQVLPPDARSSSIAVARRIFHASARVCSSTFDDLGASEYPPRGASGGGSSGAGTSERSHQSSPGAD